MMLNIRSIGLLANLLETKPGRLLAVADTADFYYEDLLIIDPAKPDKKPRQVSCVTGALRGLQLALHRKLLKPRHKPSIYSHGGVPRRSIKSNARAHLESVFVYSTDVEKFYPSVPGRK